MGRIPQDVIDSVLAAHDIVEVVSRYVPLKPAGRAFKALCPFHEEKTPSFTVNPERQSFKCFGCGKGGGVFHFLMEHEGLTFPEAVRSLARERAIQVPDTQDRDPAAQSRVEAVRQVLALAQAFFVRQLAADGGQEARTYLAGRGYDEQAARRFGLGCAPAAWDALLGAASRRGIGSDLLEAAGLAVGRSEGEGHYDRFRHRVTFPISDLQGRVLTFGARALRDEDQPKYLNGPETVVFKKANVLYALDRARDAIRKQGEALLMEGYTDVLMCHLHGVENTVAGMGTAFTQRQSSLLKRFAQRVVLVYDADEAGRTAAERTLDILVAEGLDVRVVLLPAGRDVDEILLEEGREAFDSILAGRLDLLGFKLALARERFDVATPQGRARAAESVVASIVRVPRPIERDQLLRALAEELPGQGAEAAVRREAARLLGQAVMSQRRPLPAAAGTEQEAEPRLAQRVRNRNTYEAECFLLAGWVFFPELRDQIARSVGPEDFAFPAHRRLYNAALRMQAAGETCDVRVLARVLADDGEAQVVLAGLPEDPTLEERVPFQLEYMERRRREKRRALEILQQLGGDVCPVDDVPGNDQTVGNDKGETGRGPGPVAQERDE